MKYFLPVILLLLLCVFLPLAWAVSPETETEILQLLRGLESSDCSFYRNGTWYDGEEASHHLKRKYDYLARRDLINSSEQFIGRGASKSSFSGRKYKVRCQDVTEESGVYLRRQLEKIRTSQAPDRGQGK